MTVLPPRATPGFALRTAGARKVLVVEIAGLGDLIHTLPALWSVRRTYPDADLHCLVREANAGLLALAPWIDRVWSYRRSPRLDPMATIAIVRRLRAERFDVAIDLMGSDHASIAARLSGAPHRLTRRPGPIKPRFAWRWCATDLVEHPLDAGSMHRQRWQALQTAGIVSPEPVFELTRGTGASHLLATDERALPFVHVSPCTRRSHKELPTAQLAMLLACLHAARPGLRFVLSCADVPRERRLMDALLAALPFAPWKVFAGGLDVRSLFELIGDASLHLGGDTGSMHLAWLAGTPSVGWMSAFANHRAWAPEGERHATLLCAEPAGEQLRGLSTEALLASALERLPALLPAACTEAAETEAA